MKITILEEKVRQNLGVFKHFIQELVRKYAKDLTQKTCQAFLNRKTGDLSLEKQLPLEEWKAVSIKVLPEEGIFEVITPGHEEVFELKELDPEACVVLAKTIHLFNQIAFDPHKKGSIDEIFQQFCDLDVEGETEGEKEQDFIQKLWHSLDRVQAEELLFTKSKGTYFFRRDEFAGALEKTLNESSDKPIRCITLTYLGEEEKVCEKTIVHKDGQWLFYDDDLQLRGNIYPHLTQLLAELKKEVQFPLEI